MIADEVFFSDFSSGGERYEKKFLVLKQEVACARNPGRVLNEEKAKNIIGFIEEMKRHEFEKCILSKFKRLPSVELASILWSYYYGKTYPKSSNNERITKLYKKIEMIKE